MENLTDIILKHEKWTSGEEGGIRADLRGADLYGANLYGANLRDADLRDANLRDANLRDANGNRKQIKSIHASKDYPIVYTAEYLQIGCERHKIGEWWEFNDERIARMEGKKALTFWRKWKNVIKHIIELSPAEPGKKND
jgi:hypothetical protein